MHIPQDELQKFQNGTMDTDEMIHFLEHMEQCDFCLDQLLQEEEAASSTCPFLSAGRNSEKSFFTGGNMLPEKYMKPLIGSGFSVQVYVPLLEWVWR